MQDAIFRGARHSPTPSTSPGPTRREKPPKRRSWSRRDAEMKLGESLQGNPFDWSKVGGAEEPSLHHQHHRFLQKSVYVLSNPIQSKKIDVIWEGNFPHSFQAGRKHSLPLEMPNASKLPWLQTPCPIIFVHENGNHSRLAKRLKWRCRTKLIVLSQKTWYQEWILSPTWLWRLSLYSFDHGPAMSWTQLANDWLIQLEDWSSLEWTSTVFGSSRVKTAGLDSTQDSDQEALQEFLPRTQTSGPDGQVQQTALSYIWTTNNNTCKTIPSIS